MIEVGNGIGLDQVVVIGIEDQITEIDFSIDKTIKKAIKMVRIIKEEILRQGTIELYKIIEYKPLEGNKGETMEIVILIAVEAGQEIANFLILLGVMMEVELGQDHV